jgi:hypothetical protein
MVTAVEREVGPAFYRGLTAALRKSGRQTPKHPTRTQGPRASCLKGSHSHRSMRFRRLLGVFEYQSQGQRRPRNVRLLCRPCRRGLRPCNLHRRDRGLDVRGGGLANHRHVVIVSPIRIAKHGRPSRPDDLATTRTSFARRRAKGRCGCRRPGIGPSGWRVVSKPAALAANEAEV